MSKSRGINAPKTNWTQERRQHLEQHYPDKTAKALSVEMGISVDVIYAKAHALGLKKSEAFKASAQSGRLDGLKGAQTRFPAGHKPWTAGMKGVRMSPATEFRPGRAPSNRQEVGALRINTMGDIDIKVAPGPRQWVSLRRYTWESLHGPIPDGMCVVTRNGDGHDTRPENLQLVTRKENLDMHLHKKFPKELRVAMQLRGRLVNQIKRVQ